MKHAKLILAIGVAAAAAAYGLAYYGRRRTVGALAPWFGDADASSAAASLTFKQALEAGARAAIGRNPLPIDATVTVEAN